MAAYFLCIETDFDFDEAYEITLLDADELSHFSGNQISNKYASALLEGLEFKRYVIKDNTLWPYVIDTYYLTDKAYAWIIEQNPDIWYTRLYNEYDDSLEEENG